MQQLTTKTSSIKQKLIHTVTTLPTVPPQTSKPKSSNKSDKSAKALVANATLSTPKHCWNFCSPDRAVPALPEVPDDDSLV